MMIWTVWTVAAVDFVCKAVDFVCIAFVWAVTVAQLFNFTPSPFLWFSSWILIPFDLHQSLCSVNIVNQLALQQKKDQQKTNPNLMILSDKRMYLLLAVSGYS